MTTEIMTDETMENTKETKQISKFEAMLGDTGNNLLKRRASTYSQSVEAVMKTKIIELESAINDINLELSKHEDLGVETSDSLRIKDFNAKDWVTKLNQLSFQKVETQEALDIVKKNYYKYFG